MCGKYLNVLPPDGTNWPRATGGGEGMVGGVSVWGDFEVHFDEVLGRGGMGAVYRARQMSLDRWVALKVLDTSRAADSDLAEGFFEKFRIEALALARLKDPRIVSVIQAGENDGRRWIAMELVEGRTVEQRLSEEGAFPEREAVRICLEVARALEAALRQGIVHRDVKPANVFLLPDGSVKLGDFGLARSPEFSRTRITDANAVACTPAYASPEHAEGRPTDHRGDIYSLGCVLYEMLTERPPFMGDSQMETLLRHASEPPPPPRLLNPKVSPRVEDVILKCLRKDPAARYQTYTDLIGALESKPAETSPFPLLPAAAAGLALLGAIVVAVFTSAVPHAPAAPPAEAKAVESPPPPPAAEPVPEPAEAPPPPVVRTPEPGDFAPSPPREDAPDSILSRHRPGRNELKTLEKILAFSRETLAERTSYRFERALSGIEALGPFTEWTAVFAEADLERSRAAARAWAGRAPFRPGQDVVLPLRDGRSVRGCYAGENETAFLLDLPGGTREAVPLMAVSPLAFCDAESAPLVRAGAGDAAGALAAFAALPEVDRARHAPGVVDQAIEEALRSADGGDFGPLRRLEIPPELQAATAGPLKDRLRRLEHEARAAELMERMDFTTLLREHTAALAAARAAAELLEEFEKSMPRDADHELVGEIPWGTWSADTQRAPGGAARLDAASRSYLLTARGAGDRVWLKRKLQGARHGYQVAFRFGPGAEEGATFAVALSFTRWIDITARSAALFRSGEDGRVRALRRVDLRGPVVGGVVTVAPRPPLVLVYLDGRLLLALPEGECALADGLQLGAGGGTVIVESVRVKDRTR